jgi:hypothetical protein
MMMKFKTVMLIVVATLMAVGAKAGDLDPTNAPGSTMHTLEEIYQKVDQVLTQSVSVANIYYVTNVVLFGTNALVAKTGQITPDGVGSDGDLQKGVTWPNPRFTDNSDGTVTDNLTGLIWLKQANPLVDKQSWMNAITACNTLSNGTHGLTDASAAGDWRLPNRLELLSLHDLEFYSPSICDTMGTGQCSDGDPFTGVQGAMYYWSSTVCKVGPNQAWGVSMAAAGDSYGSKTNLLWVWPVRGGQ